MRPVARLVAVALFVAAPHAVAQGFDAPVVELGLTGGAQGLTKAEDSIWGGAKAAAGWKARLGQTVLRVEATGAVLFSRAFWHTAYDVGLAVSVDLFALMVDRYLSAAFFARVEGVARFTAPFGQVQTGFVPTLALGIHAAGFWASVTGGAELGLRLPTNVDPQFTGGVQVGVEFVELVNFVNRRNEGKQPFPN